MKPTEEQITRWIDGELHDYEREEFEAVLKEHPELLSDKTAAGQTGKLLREALSAEEEPPYSDFFNSQIQRQIRNAEMDRVESPAPARARSGILVTISSWFRSPLGALGAAAAAAVVTFVAVKGTESPAPNPNVGDAEAFMSSIYTPDENISVDSFFSEEAGASVMIVDGLAALPASYKVKGNIAGDLGVDNAVAVGTGWRGLPSDEAVVDWISVNFREADVPFRSL